ncbi:MAG: 4Fe-4S dicluster domain-containing protein, partial [Actinomycetota bacterium]
RIVAPQIRDKAIVYRELEQAADLPVGWIDEQAPGAYRLRRRGDHAYFGYAVGPDSWKRELLPPRVRLWQAGPDLEPADVVGNATPTAFVGVRPCELAAIAIQDRVFVDGKYQDADYAARRREVFVVAVDCGEPSDLCFCPSPVADGAFDIALTEILTGEHRFLVRTGSERGAAVVGRLRTSEATEDDLAAATRVTQRAAKRLRGRFDDEGVHDLLLRSLESPHWDDVAARCMTCGNCTLVCPTCFCTHIEDESSLDGTAAARTRVWDTCFSVQYAEMHGGNSRPSPQSRYRQWLTHKLATWHDQFGSSGCVGCARCITWCPAHIDIREEVERLRAGA